METPTGGEPPTPADKKPKQGRTREGKFQKGNSGNPHGRKPGVPNLNRDLITAVKEWQKGEKTYLEELLELGLTQPPVAVALIKVLFSDPTPHAAPVVSVDNSKHQHQTNILKDPQVREAALELERRIQRVGMADAGGNGPSRQ